MNLPVATQPEYRALMLYDHLPEGCIAHLVIDSHSTPHIRPGELVVVDTVDRKVRHLETYVIEWIGGRRSVCESVRCEFNWTDPAIPREGWTVRSISGLRGRAAVDAIHAARAVASTQGGMLSLAGLAWSEGPYRSDDGYLESKLVGCVIGIYAPNFEEPKRAIISFGH